MNDDAPAPAGCCWQGIVDPRSVLAHGRALMMASDSPLGGRGQSPSPPPQARARVLAPSLPSRRRHRPPQMSRL